ncbi:hypothetical protein [Spirillospora sp. CA-294931]|uniref:hypothetical protein n=1 Tax=Spirillospora sp. CA-294931 TaxID=3240042 RepID=UPI003D8A8D94
MAYLWSGPRPGDRAGPGTDELREQWRGRSMAVGWSLPGDWWAPAVEAVVEAVCDGRGMAVACVWLGQARGRAGVGLGETLDDLGALFTVLAWPDPPLTLVRCVAEGWVDSGLMSLATESCEDPLTGLTTMAYLRSRLAELYRAAAELGISPAETHALVIVDLSDGSEPWRRLARAIVVAHDMRVVFRGGETLTLVGTGRAAALVPTTSRLEPQVASLRRLLTRTLARSDDPDGGRLVGGGGFLAWIERLPGSPGEAQELLEVLAG